MLFYIIQFDIRNEPYFYCIAQRLALNAWRDAVSRSHTAAQLAMALYVLESCVAWDKSIMKAVSLYFVVYRCQVINVTHSFIGMD